MHAILVTVHSFVKGKPETRLLSFHSLSGSHTGQHISEVLEDIFEYHALRDKTLCTVTDNVANMRKALALTLEVDDQAVHTDCIVDNPA